MRMNLLLLQGLLGHSWISKEMLFAGMPATFVALGLTAGLVVDTFRAWGVDRMILDCKPQFSVDLNGSKLGSEIPAHAKEQAIVIWVQGVSHTYGAPYANFWHAKDSGSGSTQCHANGGSHNYCGFAFGQPCLRTLRMVRP
jgi:hypothetical protein